MHSASPWLVPTLRMGETGMSRAVGNSGSVREVRIALVCYGGVSLAIYMHGVTRELYRLVTASSRFDEEPNPFRPSCSEHVYWELLHELAATRVSSRGSWST